MILFGCLLAFGAAAAPRIILILAWIFSDRWAAVWQEQILAPLLGIIVAPYTTIMFMLAATITPNGDVTIEGFAWLWLVLGVFLDLWKWGNVITNRQAGTKYGQSIYKDAR
jgi:hypothetical protein